MPDSYDIMDESPPIADGKISWDEFFEQTCEQMVQETRPIRLTSRVSWALITMHIPQFNIIDNYFRSKKIDAKCEDLCRNSKCQPVRDYTWREIRDMESKGYFDGRRFRRCLGRLYDCTTQDSVFTQMQAESRNMIDAFVKNDVGALALLCDGTLKYKTLNEDNERTDMCYAAFKLIETATYVVKIVATRTAFAWITVEGICYIVGKLKGETYTRKFGNHIVLRNCKTRFVADVEAGFEFLLLTTEFGEKFGFGDTQRGQFDMGIFATRTLDKGIIPSHEACVCLKNGRVRNLEPNIEAPFEGYVDEHITDIKVVYEWISCNKARRGVVKRVAYYAILLDNGDMINVRRLKLKDDNNYTYYDWEIKVLKKNVVALYGLEDAIVYFTQDENAKIKVFAWYGNREFEEIPTGSVAYVSGYNVESFVIVHDPSGKDRKPDSYDDFYLPCIRPCLTFFDGKGNMDFSYVSETIQGATQKAVEYECKLMNLNARVSKDPPVYL